MLGSYRRPVPTLSRGEGVKKLVDVLFSFLLRRLGRSGLIIYFLISPRLWLAVYVKELVMCQLVSISTFHTQMPKCTGTALLYSMTTHSMSSRDN